MKRKGVIMYSTKILDDYEYETFNVFSTKLNPNTKHDYLSKVILFKEFLKRERIDLCYERRL